MSSKRFKKLPENTKNLTPNSFEKLLPLIKQNCTTKFDESIDLNFRINNKQKKSEINIRTAVNLPGGTGKKVKVAVVCEENKSQEAKEAGADRVGGDEFVEKIKGGDIDFEKLICTPSMMIKLSKLGKILGPKTLPSFESFIIILGVQINFSKFNSPPLILSTNSSPPTISAPASFASCVLLSSQTTATFTFFPVPPGKLTTVLILTSLFFCL